MKKIIVLTIFVFSFLCFGDTEVVEVSPRPWNGYWWPIINGGLCTGLDYNQHPSPMEKYDFATGQQYLATMWELENHYNPDAPNWWGHCNGWAASSVVEEEPSHKSTYNSVVFYVGDIKGLLAECYQNAYGTVYGTRYTGDNGDDAFNDINPLDFQNVLETYLKDNGIPILIDADPTEEIWTYPLYRYELSYTDEGSTRHVVLKIYCATDIYDTGTLDPDDTDDTHFFTKTYTYDLTLDINGNPISGQWTGTSVNDHPDFAWYPEHIASTNPYVSLETVHTIISKGYTSEDDSMEPDNDFEQAHIVNENFIYRTEDDDYFKFFIEPGENITLKLFFNEYSSYALGVLYDKDENFLDYFTYDNIGEFAYYNFKDLSEITDYYLVSEYPIIGYYNDNYSLKAEEQNQIIVIPHTLDTSFWDNFVYGAFIPYTIKNEETEEETNIEATTGSLVGVFDGNSRLIEKDINFSAGFKELPLSTSDGIPLWIKINTNDDHIKLLSFYLSEGDGSMGLFYSNEPAKRFILPHVPPEIDYWWYGLVIVNPSHLKSTRVYYKLYGYDKHILKEGYFDMPPYGKIVDVFENLFPNVEMDNTSYLEFYSKDNIVVSALYGTRNHRELAYVPADSQTVKEGQTVYITKDLMPQTENPWAGIAIVNPSDTTNAMMYATVIYNNNTQTNSTITLYLHEKKVGVFEDFLPDNVNLDEVERIEFQITQGAISIFALYGDHDQGMLASYIPPLKNDGMATYYLPNINEHGLKTLLFIKNEKNYSVQTTIYGLDQNGQQTESITLNLTNFEYKEVIPSEIFNNPDLIKTFKIYSSRTITPIAVIKSDDNRFYDIIGPDFKKETIIEESQ